MSDLQSAVHLLMVPDDSEDFLLLKEAIEESRLQKSINFVEDGEELMDYLYQRGKYSDSEACPEPALIILDLDLPKKNGREVLREVKSDPRLRHIPIVVLTTSSSEDDVRLSYSLGANSYITKPARFGSLVEIMNTLHKYWFNIVTFPNRENVV